MNNFLCDESAEDSTKQLLDNTADAGTAADTLKTTVAIGAAAAGTGSAWPQATSFFGAGLANGLSKLGTFGTGAAGLGILGEAFLGNYQSALYDTADFFVYRSLADVGASGAIPTLGFSATAAGGTMLLYHNAGGAKGLVQSALCH